MEFPNLGQNCTHSTCNKLDFLPIKCDACGKTFCNDHYQYAVHNCPNAYKKNNQVPECPLCNKPVPVAKGQLPDYSVGIHIDNDCQADPAKNIRKVFANKCTVKGCKIKEVIPVICKECSNNYCLKHRHPTDHKCDGKRDTFRNKAVNAALSRQTQNTPNLAAEVQGNMSDDEALARALQLSMQESSGANSKKTQEELDLALARQLQAAESRTQTVGGERSHRDRCIVS